MRSVIPPNSRETGLLYPITNNERLIEFLKERLQRGVIEILQHGFSHSVVEGYRGEFGINTSNQEANLNRDYIDYEGSIWNSSQFLCSSL